MNKKYSLIFSLVIRYCLSINNNVIASEVQQVEETSTPNQAEGTALTGQTETLDFF